MEKDTLNKYWREGWDAFWQAKRIADCPYVGANADLWCEGYALAEKVGYENEMSEPGAETYEF